MNQVFITGNVGRDAEVTQFDNGRSVTSFSVATNESFKDNRGEWVDRVEWHNVVCWGRLSEVAAGIRKGMRVCVVGKLKTEKYTDRNNVEKYVTKVVAKQVMRICSIDDVSNSETVVGSGQVMQDGGSVGKTQVVSHSQGIQDDLPF